MAESLSALVDVARDAGHDQSGGAGEGGQGAGACGGQPVQQKLALPETVMSTSIVCHQSKVQLN